MSILPEWNTHPELKIGAALILATLITGASIFGCNTVKSNHAKQEEAVFSQIITNKSRFETIKVEYKRIRENKWGPDEDMWLITDLKNNKEYLGIKHVGLVEIKQKAE